MAEYQHASDAFDGTARSGVIRTLDGRWIACGAEDVSPDWDTYVTWRDTMGSVTDPYKPPLQGGVAIVLQEGEEAIGSMLDSLPGVGSPVNVDVPVAMPATAVVGDSLSCTMGNWQGEPTGYTYEWMCDGALVGVNPSYIAQPVDAGKAVMCIVTAHNAHGVTAAPPSNAVSITAARAAGEEHAAKEEHRQEHHTHADAHHDARRPNATTGSGSRSR